MSHEVHRLPRGEVHVARAEKVYPLLEPGSVRLIISDGPYGMGKADWDRQRGPDGLREWYAPHVEAWGRVAMEAATVYVWGTAQSVRALQPLMEAHGWTWRVQVVWHKPDVPSLLGWQSVGSWPDEGEYCDVYTRLAPPFTMTVPTTSVWTHSVSRLSREQLKGSTVPHRARRGSLVEQALHPCQKPVTFYDRIIRASSRPGDLILEPFGGTLRAAAACETLPHHEARRYVCAEPDEDGRGYVPAALAAIRQTMPRLL